MLNAWFCSLGINKTQQSCKKCTTNNTDDIDTTITDDNVYDNVNKDDDSETD